MLIKEPTISIGDTLVSKLNKTKHIVCHFNMKNDLIGFCFESDYQKVDESRNLTKAPLPDILKEFTLVPSLKRGQVWRRGEKGNLYEIVSLNNFTASLEEFYIESSSLNHKIEATLDAVKEKYLYQGTRGDFEREYSKTKEVKPVKEDDALLKSQVNNPSHYGGKDNPYEAIKVIEAWGLNFHLGNTVKYLSRMGKKEGEASNKDLLKAQWYLDREVKNKTKKELSKPDDLVRDGIKKLLKASILYLNQQLELDLELIYRYAQDGHPLPDSLCDLLNEVDNENSIYLIDVIKEVLQELQDD
jgi:hypothetical protein